MDEKKGNSILDETDIPQKSQPPLWRSRLISTGVAATMIQAILNKTRLEEERQNKTGK